ncbi:MAG: hypothetical protein IPK33_11170 [Gemmatimonadetes bacterium]|nr:hypothetical protein [Gemmatimonadota bacterium]
MTDRTLPTSRVRAVCVASSIATARCHASNIQHADRLAQRALIDQVALHSTDAHRRLRGVIWARLGEVRQLRAMTYFSTGATWISRPLRRELTPTRKRQGVERIVAGDGGRRPVIS